jgi:hypothetical protein
MSKFAVLIESWAVYVKEWDFFVEQGGLAQPWGKKWKPIMARDIESARRKGISRRDGIPIRLVKFPW